MFVAGAVGALVLTGVLTALLGLHLGVLIMWLGILIVCPGSIIVLKLNSDKELGVLGAIFVFGAIGIGVYCAGLITLVIMLALGMRSPII